ncbi:hypothetical protein PG987_004558 [Apiospora arundinis]
MWLIDTKSLELVFKTDPSQVRYAILSHTWEDEEVSFQEFQEPHLSKHKKGWKKIEMTCQLARDKHGIDYAWVDTCCIDKSSSAELSEAINSMFRYYELSSIWDLGLPSFSHCRWLTRGWTLQELIAPRIVQFYDASWSYRGSKEEWSESLARATGIDTEALSPQRQLDNYSVATRFHWASKRETTRKEDLAYCLLGIFGVYMPLLYGESENAFLRLQEEICKMTNDMSIFAWTARPGDEQIFRGLFARSPAEFVTACIREPYNSRLDKEFVMTNKGLRFDSSILATRVMWINKASPEHDLFIDEHFMDLKCFAIKPDTAVTKESDRTPIGIYLGKLPGGYARIDPLLLADAIMESHLDLPMWMEAPQAMYAFRSLTQEASRLLEEELRAQVVVQLEAQPQRVLQAEPQSVWHPHQSAFRLRRPNSIWRDASICFWLLEVKQMETPPAQRPRLSHPNFECLVICTISFDPDAGSQKARAHVVVENNGRWTIGRTSLSKPPRARFTKSIVGQSSLCTPSWQFTERTVAHVFQEWSYKDDELAASAVHSDSKTDVMVGVNVSKLDLGDSGFRIDVTFSDVHKAGTKANWGHLTKRVEQLGL